MTNKQIKTDIIAIVLIMAVAITLLGIGYRVGYNKAREDEWNNNKQVISYIVDNGDTLWGIAEQHKPQWLDTRDYIRDVKSLNNLDSSSLSTGDKILIYAYGRG